MRERFGYKNVMAVPRLEKVVVNCGFGREVVALSPEEQKKLQQNVVDDLTLICGQKAVLTKAKKSVASFKLRQGLAVGAKVTLRGRKMQDFVDRFIFLTLPRSRDFKGIDPQDLDRDGNLSVGLKEQIAFPEVSPEAAKKIFGLQATFAVKAVDRDSALEFLKLLGFPFKSF